MRIRESRRRRKLLIDEKVEVRSTEDGFLGSWHSGNVISSDKGFRLVQYHHILSDHYDNVVENGGDVVDYDSCDKMIDTVKVSGFIDGVGGSDGGLGMDYRGAIRPFREAGEVDVRGLRYGECVDVYYKDAWWEGVVFDRCKGSGERNVFFPDMGDAMRVEGGTEVRVTEDWDEYSGVWRVRGNWVFLELVEEFERECWPLLVSVKQVWYDVRGKKGFEENVKEWTCGRRDVWRAVLFEVVMDNLRITMREFFETVEGSERKGLEESFRFLELNGPALYASLKSKGYDEISGDGVVAVVDTGRLDALPLSSSVEPRFQDEAPCASPQKTAIVPTDMDDKLAMNDSCNSSCKVSKTNKHRVWVSGDIVPEYCADAVEEYSEVSNTRQDRHVVKLKLRRHLVFLGWKAEYIREKGIPRWRYVPPNGSKEYFGSLVKVCEHLKKSDSAKVSLFRQDEQNRLSDAAATTVVTPLYEQYNEQIKDCPDYDCGMIEPEYCPQAVINYYFSNIKENVYPRDDNKLRNMQLKAKKHLSAVGWKLFYTHENNMRSKDLRYSSPCGKLYVSLQSACKAFLDEKRNVAKLAEAQLVGEGAGSAIETKEYQAKHIKKRKSSVLYPGSQSRSAKSLKKKKNIMEVQTRGGSNSFVKGRVSGSRKRARVMVVPSSYPRNPRTVLSWLIENNVICKRQNVEYRKDGEKLAEGTMTRDGIRCSCCKETFSVSNFEVHAIGACCQPSANLWLLASKTQPEKSLHEYQLELRQNNIAGSTAKAVKYKKKNRNKDDDLCSICHTWGDLICCDGCPSAFHECCLGLKDIPGGNWYCPLCCCKICGLGINNGNTEVSEEDSVFSCHQCKLPYHASCQQMKESVPTSHPKGFCFCNEKCKNIQSELERRLGKPVLVGTDLTWTLLKYVESDECGHDPSNIADSVDNYCKLNVALGVMHECFEPMKDPQTKSDLVEDIIFSRWSELKRLNFSGFYTVLLQKNDELITVAAVRIYGDKVAEMPLVATRFVYRRQGMCRILMNELEKVLTEVGVERLVLPAASSVLNTWISSFGFSKMLQSDKLKLMNYTFLEFQGTTMCQKFLKEARIESSPPGSALQHCSDANRNVDIGLEGSISSLMLQPEQALAQKSTNFAGGSGSDTGAIIPCQSEIFLKNSFEGGTDCKKDMNRGKAEIIYYKRRRISKPGGAQVSVC
nr:PREDICTED: uncharacterized protein LOC108199541 isoform X1 [Daucus carota subsp. sativus]XP_017222883.1 PREDICTED: uncharacterized protein LOC108199541 isoform X1 [Daucus carota subsp. sativus]XP_017222884.1 PREDICTED: uncharacterized protein LOC108199541 isoform X1 [Daucus carota subsp. sativus]XP_017222885.1 PREDICTED: uncharacterized protein LOC108199541 isoform X1 [Daucus carota subsp. sativus]XP_017222886.1 PREDICTED: uncharacterized protein LOC108199541 isoform X1 [Daucus carota subsp.